MKLRERIAALERTLTDEPNALQLVICLPTTAPATPLGVTAACDGVATVTYDQEIEGDLEQRLAVLPAAQVLVVRYVESDGNGRPAANSHGATDA